MPAGEDLPRVEVTSRQQLRDWLEAHHRTSRSVWLVTWKKSNPDWHIPYGDIVDECLCFGWVDSLPRKLDGNRSMLLISPRKRGSAWSAINKSKVERLTATGAMRPAGLAVVEAAQKDGAWSFLDEVERLEVPHDLASALDGHAGARDKFDRFPRSVRRGILEWIKQAKQAETRQARVIETARLAANNERANQFRKR